MSEKSSAKAKPASKAGAGKAKAKGKGKGGGNLLSWLVLAGLTAGFAWVLWPFFSPAPGAAKPMPQQMRQIATQNPEAEVFNPEGKEAAPAADGVKKK